MSSDRIVAKGGKGGGGKGGNWPSKNPGKPSGGSRTNNPPKK